MAFFDEAPSADRVELLRAYENEHEEFRAAGRDMYFFFRQGIRNAKLTENMGKLQVQATLRNRKTVAKLAALAEATKL